MADSINALGSLFKVGVQPQQDDTNTINANEDTKKLWPPLWEINQNSIGGATHIAGLPEMLSNGLV